MQKARQFGNQRLPFRFRIGTENGFERGALHEEIGIVEISCDDRHFWIVTVGPSVRPDGPRADGSGLVPAVEIMINTALVRDIIKDPARSPRELTDAMVESGATSVAYETIRDREGRLPLLTPMSEVAGRMAVLEGARHLERPCGGRGVLISGVPGVR